MWNKLRVWKEKMKLRVPKHSRWVFNERGGGEPAQPQVVQMPPQAPAPGAGESAADLAKARLEYDPQMAQMEWGLQQQYQPQMTALSTALQQQYAPQLAQLYTDVQRQQMPQLQALQAELFPQQTQVTEAGAGRVLEQLADPGYRTPGEISAERGSREEATQGLIEAMRTRANLGGGLYGGRAAGAEERGVSDLMRAFEQEDYQRRQMAGQQAQQAAIPYMQTLYPQVGMPQAQQQQFGFEGVTPSADVLYNAMAQQARGWQPQALMGPSRAGGVNLGILGRWGGSTYV